MTDQHTRPRRVPASVKRAGEYWVLVPDELVDVAVVNATGHHVFQLCDGSRSAAVIAREVAGTIGVDVDTVTTDVATYIAQLEQAGLLTTEDP